MLYFVDIQVLMNKNTISQTEIFTYKYTKPTAPEKKTPVIMAALYICFAEI